MSMFTFNTTGSLSSSQGRSSGSSTKSNNYVPSTYIAKRLQLEEEARRQGHKPNSQDSSSSHTDSTQHWRGPDDVLAPGYSSGPLGYQVPAQSSTSQPRFPLNEGTRAVNMTDINGAGVGIGIQGLNSTISPREPGSPTTSRLYPDLFSPGSPDPAASPKGILRGGESRQDLTKEDGVLRKSTSVRFNAAADMGSPRPGTPSIYSQAGSSNSPFVSSPYIHSSANLQSALKEPGKVDVLSHRAASTGQPQLNSSLGPALGSVSGTAQPAAGYSSPKMQNDLHASSMRSSQFAGATSGTGSVFQYGVDGSLVRQNSKTNPLNTKANQDEDEDDKEKERYMPYVLLGNNSVKGSKMEPFVDESNGRSHWDSDSFQQTGSRLAPHLIGEDVPPADTLYDIAKKEKYYSCQTSSFSQMAAPLQDTRPDSFAAGEPSSASKGLSSSAPSTDGFDSIITYGFPPEATSYILNQFRSFGMILRYESGVYGQVESESFNWLKIQYSGAWAARNAITRHLKSVGKFVVGVHACRSFSAKKQSSLDMSMDTRPDGDFGAKQMIENDLTEAEAREVEAGVDTLLRMRAQGLHAEVGHVQDASTRARHASLHKSWSQGSVNGLGLSRWGSSVSSSLGGSGSGAPGRSAAMDQGDDDMTYILSHSLTSGGSLGRSGRGRGFERGGQDEFLRSRSKDQLGQDQEQKLGGGESAASAVDIVTYTLRVSTAATPPAGGSVWISPSRPLGDSTASDSTLFASTGGVLMDSDAHGGASTNSAPGSFHVQKKQRLSSGLFAPSSSAPSGTVPQAQFGTGRNRASVLIDNPDLVDEWGAPLLSKMRATGGGGGGSAAAGGANGASGAGGTAGGESMFTTVLNAAKKRLFWG
ncbi:hypothetical protein BGX23_010679 [Mortierella sp. AD031]|nr:hypothetical protein BGX23_010679 [Mortierella sp. AD031]